MNLKSIFIACALATALLALPVQPATAQSGGAIGDAQAGAQIYARECAQCHQVGPGAAHRIGPHLNRIFDRRAASHEGFNYSRPLQRMGADGMVWRLDTLDAYLENPRALVSGTRMAYRGLRDDTQRSDLLAYLRASHAIVARGHDAATVTRMEHLLYVAEYKRRQAAPGVKITRKNFGRDRRYPITNRYRDGA
jgi:cytochrome c2